MTFRLFVFKLVLCISGILSIPSANILIANDQPIIKYMHYSNFHINTLHTQQKKEKKRYFPKKIWKDYVNITIRV